jgi:hypothetical protein
MEKFWLSVQDKEKAHVNDSQIMHDYFVINLSRLNTPNLIPNTSIRIAAFCHMTVYSLVQIYKRCVPSVHFHQST